MASRKRSKAKPAKGSRGGRKIAPRSSSTSSQDRKKPSVNERRPAVNKPTKQVERVAKKPTKQVKRVTKKLVAKKPTKQVERVTKKPTKQVAKKPTKQVKRVAKKPIAKKLTKQVKRVAKKPIAKKPTKQVKRVAKKPTKQVKRVAKKPTKQVKRVAKKPTKQVKRVAKKPAGKKPTKRAPKPRKLSFLKLTEEQRREVLEQHAREHWDDVSPQPILNWGRNGVYSTIPLGYMHDEDTIGDTQAACVDSANEVHDILRMRHLGESGRIVLWTTFDIGRYARGIKEGYSEQIVMTIDTYNVEVGRYWTGHYATVIEKYEKVVSEKLAEMLSDSTYLIAAFVYGQWKSSDRGRRRR